MNYQYPIIPVRNEFEARNYPIALGNSLTFKDESAPYVYVKTMGFSPFDKPNFEKFRLVKEEDASMTSQNDRRDDSASETPDNTFSGLKAEIEALTQRFEVLERKVNGDVE